MKLLDIPMDVNIIINDVIFNQFDAKDVDEGDMVLDLRDGAWTYVDMKHDDEHVALKTGMGAEVGVHVSRLRKLLPA